MRERDLQVQWMDDPEISREDHLLALTGFAHLNLLSGVGLAMYRYIRRLAMARPDRRLAILDVASGAGDVPISWARRAQREGWDLQLTMTDIREVALQEQRRRAQVAKVDVRSIQHDCLGSPLPRGFDLITTSLFMHHLDNHQVIRLLQSMQTATDGALLMCDLERSRTNLMLVKTVAAIVTRSPVVHHDAAASIRAAFTAGEFRRLAEDALDRPVRVHRAFPCRFIACLEEVALTEGVPAFA